MTSCYAALQLKKDWPWTVEPTNGPLEQLSYGVCLTWACHELKDVCHLSRRLGLQALDDQHFGLWLNLWHAVRGQDAFQMKVGCAGVLLLHI